MGELVPPGANRGYKTCHFLEFTVDGVEVDAIVGMVIGKDGADYECPFSRENIGGYAEVNGESIPLQNLSDWRRYYELMGRLNKAEIIDR